jgi:hypothetical protein
MFEICHEGKTLVCGAADTCRLFTAKTFANKRGIYLYVYDAHAEGVTFEVYAFSGDFNIEIALSPIQALTATMRAGSQSRITTDRDTTLFIRNMLRGHTRKYEYKIDPETRRVYCQNIERYGAYINN